jgi:hypothetical protein
VSRRIHITGCVRLRPPAERLDVQAERKRIAATTAALAQACDKPNPLRREG